ncbi:MAG: hypothetical protein CXT78_04460 [Thaumarchaeota archaeon]|nr:MAG: hypothetical protein CXT78_04460 [Nitrososphaerota archaeon]
MDIEQKKGDVKADIARAPENVVFSRIDICDELQLADLMKDQFTPYFKNTATQNGSGDSLHNVCINLAKQRALLQGAAVGEVMNFSIGTTSQYATSGTITLPDLEDSSYSNKTSFGFITLHDENETGGSVTLSSVSNANTSIINDDGNAITYFTDFSKYFLTRSRANGELISIDENTAPYTTPTIAEPFIPTNTINGEIFRGTAPDPTANSDVRYEFSTAANTSGGNAGGDLDIVENKWTGNTFVTIELSSVVGTFATSETISDFDLNTATIKTYVNTSSVFLEGRDSKGTFVVDELISDLSTNATISTVATLSDTEKNLTLTGSTFITGSNTDMILGFDTSNTISLDTDTVSRTGGTVTVVANNHGINPGERIALKGADTTYSEFNDTFVVEDTTANTLTFTTSNTISASPTGDFSLVNNIVFGRTSNASMSIFKRTANSSASVVFQSDDLSVGFPIANTITGSSLGATGSIDLRTVAGSWYQTKTNEVKTFYTTSTSGTWDYSAGNNPAGIPAAANAGVFWLQEYEPVKIDQLVAGTNAGASNETSSKMVLDIAIATAADSSGGFDTTIITRLPGIYFAYPLKSYADQVHGGVTTLGAYESFANVVVAPEGLEVNFDWLPLSQNAAGNKTGADIAVNGTVSNTAHIPDKVTTLNKTNFNAHLGSYNGADTSPIDDVYRSTNPDRRSSGVKVGVVYPSINTNPFFPAITANSTFLAAGYSAPAGANTANDIFAGSYTHVETGAVEPGTPGANPGTHDYRYVIQNDLKWTYATSPFAANSSGSSSTYNAPQGGAFQPVFDGSLDGELGSVSGEAAVSGTSSDSLVGTVQVPAVPIPADIPGTCSSNAHITNTQTTYSTGTVGPRSNMVMVTAQSCVGGDYECVGGSATGNENETACGLLGGGASWGPQSASWSGTAVEFGCFFNRVQYEMTSAGGALTVGSTSGMETNFAIFYQLVLDLTSASYGKNYVDPVEPSGAGSYTELGRSDASFRTVLETMKSRVDTVIGLHNTERAAVISAMAGSSAYTHPVAYQNAYLSMAAYLVDFKQTVIHRITEISNRIGYVNGKNTSSGGGSFMEGAKNYLLLDRTNSGGADAGDNVLHENLDVVQLESAVTPALSAGSMGDGFVGYSFNNGSGYANTIFSHANFLAGKKINLLGKVLKAIVSVQEMYDSATKKRSEYYEYNQAT